GFRILVASYAKALASNVPLDPETFVHHYAKERFGLDGAAAGALWALLSAPPKLITNGKPAGGGTIAQLSEGYDEIGKRINACVPKRHQDEFEHFKLMADLRMHYLAFKAVEARHNAEGYTPAEAPELLSALDNILQEAAV